MNNRYSFRNVQFVDNSATGNGGGFCIFNDISSLVCEGVIFTRCSSGNLGGGCYFLGSVCNCLRVCGSSCTANKRSFMHLERSSQSSNSAVMNETLLYECYSNHDASLVTTGFTSFITNVNSTRNHCGLENGAGIQILDEQYTDITSECKYGTFSNMTTQNCIDVVGMTLAVFYRCNIVDIVASDCVIFSSDTVSEYNECVIVRCSGGTAMFRNGFEWGSITLNNCVVCSYTSQSPLVLSTFQCTSYGTEHALTHVNMGDCYIETAQFILPAKPKHNLFVYHALYLLQY